MSFDEDAWRDALEDHRTAKDDYLRDHPHSPLPRTLDDFDGLDYYPPDPDYRFELSLDVDPEKEDVVVDTTQGGERQYRRWGTFTFRLNGAERTLAAYRSSPGEDRLWVPFRDETNGDTTYGAGRYLDLDEDDRIDPDTETWVVDFNLAYSPFCAYSDAYECPIVPQENRLDTRVEAGERYDPADFDR